MRPLQVHPDTDTYQCRHRCKATAPELSPESRSKTDSTLSRLGQGNTMANGMTGRRAQGAGTTQKVNPQTNRQFTTVKGSCWSRTAPSRCTGATALTHSHDAPARCLMWHRRWERAQDSSSRSCKPICCAPGPSPVQVPMKTDAIQYADPPRPLTLAKTRKPCPTRLSPCTRDRIRRREIMNLGHWHLPRQLVNGRRLASNA